MSKRLSVLIVGTTVFAIGLCVVPAKADLVCWWRFDGNADDSSGNESHGTENGGPTYPAGYEGQAIVLDGNDDYVEYDFAEETWSACTIALWVKTDTLGQDLYSGIFNNNSSGDDFQFHVDGADNYEYRGGENAVFGPVTTNWVHLAATCDGSDTTLYYNGGVVATVAAADTAFGRYAVGTNRSTGNYFAGTVDDVRVYNHVLSASEIQSLAPGEATLTSPDDGAILDAASVLLTWIAGEYASDVNGHEVFLSNNYEDVDIAAAAASLGLTSNEFYYMPVLDTGRVYYWRVSEVNDSHSASPWMSEIRSFTVPETTAWDPSPADNAQFIDPNVTLSWKAGLGAVLQKVYLGEDFEDVNSGAGGTYRGEQPWTTYTPGPRLPGTLYYWRIDTVRLDTTVKGPIWSFRTRSSIPISDPNLVGWWKLNDDDSGVIVTDYSGYDRYGTVQGGAQFVPGCFDEAVEFDGVDDYINIDGYKGIQGPHAFSVTAWIKTDSTVEYNTIISWGTVNSGERFDFRIQDDRLRHSQGNGNVQGNSTVNNGEWHHVAITVTDNATASSSNIRIYVDGRDDTIESEDSSPLSFVAGADVGIGLRASNGDRPYEGLMDEVRLYDCVLSPSEIQDLGLSLKAGSPSPADGALYGGTSVMLSWRAGRNAGSHNVYFGTDSNSPPPVSENQPVDSNSYGPVPVELGRTYYWYVDEVNDPCVWPGDVWNFSVEEYLVVDDFDSYVSTAGPNEPSLLSTWKDGSTNGTGSSISLHDEYAGNSMECTYDNSGATDYSEAELIYALGEDWTAGGVKAIALEFRGDVNNTGQWLYVTVEDTDGNGATVTYDDPDALLDDNWQVWNIALRDFSDDGVDLTNIKKLVVGVSDSGGSGIIYIDDIRLYPPRCLPEHAVASFDGDCTTDCGDLDMVLSYWLISDYNVAAVEPNNAGLRLHYKFDETSGTTAYDSSPAGYHGTLDANGAGGWDANGYDGYCLAFDGNFAVSVPNDVFVGISDEVTISVWVHVDANVNPNSIGRAEFAGGPAEANEPWDRLAWIQDRPEDYIGQWSHYAFVKAAGESMMRIYHNGILVAQNTESLQPIDGAGAGESKIGSKADGSGGYEGKLDDFRVYDYALPHAEILYLALGGSGQLHQPLRPVLSPMDPYEDGKITFRDFAVLGEWWLRESLWP